MVKVIDLSTKLNKIECTPKGCLGLAGNLSGWLVFVDFQIRETKVQRNENTIDL